MIYELDSSDGKVIEIPEENRTRKTTELDGDWSTPQAPVVKTYTVDTLPTGLAFDWKGYIFSKK